MRRVLLESLPALTRFYGLRPADIDDMTYRELFVYIAQMNEYQQAQERAH